MATPHESLQQLIRTAIERRPKGQAGADIFWIVTWVRTVGKWDGNTQTIRQELERMVASGLIECRTVQLDWYSVSQKLPRRRGRPPGSKNKPKPEGV